jgi:hypothetical protein
MWLIDKSADGAVGQVQNCLFYQTSPPNNKERERKMAKYNRVKHVEQLAEEVLDYRAERGAGYDTLEAEDIEWIGQEAQCGYADICEILGIELPESLQAVQGD